MWKFTLKSIAWQLEVKQQKKALLNGKQKSMKDFNQNFDIPTLFDEKTEWRIFATFVIIKWCYCLLPHFVILFWTILSFLILLIQIKSFAHKHICYLNSTVLNV